jgi:solute carrier family 45, member 1/2/4
MAADVQWVGQPKIKGSTESIRMFMLTFSVIGLTFAWGTEVQCYISTTPGSRVLIAMQLTYCTPYLLSLGMSKSRMSLVWTAGPLSGLIVQPLVGMMSDQSRSKYGRRRPFMLGGSAAVAVCYLILGWAKEIAAYFVQDEELVRRETPQVWCYTLMLWARRDITPLSSQLPTSTSSTL